MIGQTNKAILKGRLQRRLRCAMTDAEQKLWQALRGRQMAGCKFRRQHPFGDFILDFVCLEARLVVELDGGQHSQQVSADATRTNKLEKAGFRVLRFWNNDVLQRIEAVQEKILRTLRESHESHPHPSPLLEGEGIGGGCPPVFREPLRGKDQSRGERHFFPSPSRGGLGWGWGKSLNPFVFTLFLFVIFLTPHVGWTAEEDMEDLLTSSSPEGGSTETTTTHRQDAGATVTATTTAPTTTTAPAEEEKGLEVQDMLDLGLHALRTGNLSQAITTWTQYVQQHPGSEGSREISRHLTLLRQEEAKRTARGLLQQEKEIAGNIDPMAIAVFPFQNLGQPTYAPLSKGLSAMIITDLSKVKTLKVVERVQMKALLDELKLSQSGLVDINSAPRVGKLLSAGKIMTGNFFDLDLEKKIHLAASVTQTESGHVMTTSEASGELLIFYQMEKELVFKTLCGIGHCPESLDRSTREAIGTVHTKNFNAFLLYSQGLEYLDQGKYREAAQAFFLAVEEDPEFELTRKALLDTPFFPFDLAAMTATAETIGNQEAARVSTASPVSTETLPAPPPIPPPPPPPSSQHLIGYSGIDPSVEILIPPQLPENLREPPKTLVEIDLQFKPIQSVESMPMAEEPIQRETRR